MALSTLNVWTLLREDLAAYFRRRVRDEHRVEDLVQETFVRVHDRLPDLVHEDRLVGWVYRVASNALTDHRRREAGALEPERAAAELEAAAAKGDSEPNLNTDVGGWARSSIAALPEPYREAVELCEVEGLSQQAIADRLGLSLSGAKSRIQRGRAKLRDLILDCCHVEFDGHGNVVDYVERERCEGCAEC